MATKSLSIGDAFSGVSVSVYGNPIAESPLKEGDLAKAGITGGAGPLRLALIRAFRIGSGRCIILPTPALLSVYGEGEELTQPECSLAPGQAKKWTLPLGSRVIALDPANGNVEEVLEMLAGRGIDGGIKFQNPRFENGKLCVDLRIWAKISVLGASVGFDERIPICINVGQPCITVWEIGFANLQICYRAPNQICGKLCVGKFGLEKCWEECISIPFAVEASGYSGGPEKCHCHPETGAGPIVRTESDCISITVSNGEACLSIPYAGRVCISVPGSIPNGTLAEACISTCKKFGIVCGAEVSIRVAGVEVASQSWGCC